MTTPVAAAQGHSLSPEQLLVTGLVCVAVGAAGILVVRRCCPNAPRALVIGTSWWMNKFYMRVVHRVSPAGQDPFPRTGQAIVVANHRSSIDPFVIQVFTRRIIRYMTAREYCDRFGCRWLSNSAGIIPVNRNGNDFAATKTALRALRNGEIVGIFPEGGIRNASPDIPFDSQEGPEAIKHGTALLALKTDSPVITAYIHDTPPIDSVFFAFFIPSRSRVVFGEPLRFTCTKPGHPDRAELERASRQIVESIRKLKAQLDGDLSITATSSGIHK